MSGRPRYTPPPGYETRVDVDHDARRNGSKPAAARLLVEPWEDFRDNLDSIAIEYVIDGVAPAGGVGFIAAGPKNGKTWIGLHAAVAIAAGRPCLGRYTTKQRDVVYVALEGARANIRARIGCLARGLELDPDGDDLDRLHVVYKPRRIDLHDAASAGELIDAVSGLAPGVLIVDVLRRAARIRESGEGVGDFTHTLANLEPLTAAGWTIILLHHFRKWSDAAGAADTGDRMSGSGALFGHADFAIFIVKADRENRRYDLELVSRDGAQLPALTVRVHGDGTGQHGGLTYRDRAVVTSEGDEDAAERRVASIDTAILECVRRCPGEPQRGVLDGVVGKRVDVLKRLRALILTGRVYVQDGPNNAQLHYLADDLPRAFPDARETLGNTESAGGVSALPHPERGNAGNTAFPEPRETPDERLLEDGSG